MTVHGGKLFFLFIKAALLPRNVLETAKMVISSPVFCILLILKKKSESTPQFMLPFCREKKIICSRFKVLIMKNNGINI